MPQSASFRTGRPQVAELRSQIRELKKLLLDLLQLLLDLFFTSPRVGGTKWPCDGRTAPSCKNLPYPKNTIRLIPFTSQGFCFFSRLSVRQSVILRKGEVKKCATCSLLQRQSCTFALKNLLKKRCLRPSGHANHTN